MPLSIPSSNPEFRRYRTIVAWTTIALVVAGSLYLLASVAVTLRRQRNVVLGSKISTQFTGQELESCFDELRDVSVALEKHLENAYTLFGAHDSSEARRWTEEGAIWRNRWRVFGERCRLVDVRPMVPAHLDLEAMAAAYEELGSIQTNYSRELLRFGSELAPRLDRIKKRVDQLGDHLAHSPSGDNR